MLQHFEHQLDPEFPEIIGKSQISQLAGVKLAVAHTKNYENSKLKKNLENLNPDLSFAVGFI